jgi:hypothetical protein
MIDGTVILLIAVGSVTALVASVSFILGLKA